MYLLCSLLYHCYGVTHVKWDQNVAGNSLMPHSITAYIHKIPPLFTPFCLHKEIGKRKGAMWILMLSYSIKSQYNTRWVVGCSTHHKHKPMSRYQSSIYVELKHCQLRIIQMLLLHSLQQHMHVLFFSHSSIFFSLSLLSISSQFIPFFLLLPLPLCGSVWEACSMPLVTQHVQSSHLCMFVSEVHQRQRTWLRLDGPQVIGCDCWTSISTTDKRKINKKESCFPLSNSRVAPLTYRGRLLFLTCWVSTIKQYYTEELIFTILTFIPPSGSKSNYTH